MFDDAGLPAWVARGRCADADPAAFFPEEGEDPKAAKAICDRCAVSEDCSSLPTSGLPSVRRGLLNFVVP